MAIHFAPLASVNPIYAGDMVCLTEHRCPECGNPFDPEDPQTFFIAPNRKPAIGCLSVGLFCLSLVIWGLFELQRMPYRPPHDMSTFLGGPEIRFVRMLITLFAAFWLACAIALGVVVFRHRHERRELRP